MNAVPARRRTDSRGAVSGILMTKGVPPTPVLSYAAPSFTPGAPEVFARGRYVIARHGADLPPRCVRCNAPAALPLMARKMHWVDRSVAEGYRPWKLVPAVRLVVYFFESRAKRREGAHGQSAVRTLSSPQRLTPAWNCCTLSASPAYVDLIDRRPGAKLTPSAAGSCREFWRLRHIGGHRYRDTASHCQTRRSAANHVCRPMCCIHVGPST